MGATCKQTLRWHLPLCTSTNFSAITLVFNFLIFLLKQWLFFLLKLCSCVVDTQCYVSFRYNIVIGQLHGLCCAHHAEAVTFEEAVCCVVTQDTIILGKGTAWALLEGEWGKSEESLEESQVPDHEWSHTPHWGQPGPSSHFPNGGVLAMLLSSGSWSPKRVKKKLNICSHFCLLSALNFSLTCFSWTVPNVTFPLLFILLFIKKI